MTGAEQTGIVAASPNAANGEIESGSDMHAQLVRLLTMQFDSELSSAYVAAPFMASAPTLDDRLAVASMVRDEVRHAVSVGQLLNRLGVDVDARLNDVDLTFRVDSIEDLGIGRAGTDRRINVFYYPVEDWASFAAFTFLVARAGWHQLTELAQGSWSPWGEALRRVLSDEADHSSTAARWIEHQINSGGTQRDDIKAALSKWFPRAMNMFGSDNSPRTNQLLELGLRKHDNATVRDAWRRDTLLMFDRWQVGEPEWSPPWGSQSDAHADDIARDYEHPAG